MFEFAGSFLYLHSLKKEIPGSNLAYKIALFCSFLKIEASSGFHTT